MSIFDHQINLEDLLNALDIYRIHTRGYLTKPLKHEETLEHHTGIYDEQQVNPTQRMQGFVEEGRHILKVERCLYGEAVQDLENLELDDMLECYMDFLTPTPEE